MYYCRWYCHFFSFFLNFESEFYAILKAAAVQYNSFYCDNRTISNATDKNHLTSYFFFVLFVSLSKFQYTSFSHYIEMRRKQQYRCKCRHVGGYPYGVPESVCLSTFGVYGFIGGTLDSGFAAGKYWKWEKREWKPISWHTFQWGNFEKKNGFSTVFEAY